MAFTCGLLRHWIAMWPTCQFIPWGLLVRQGVPILIEGWNGFISIAWTPGKQANFKGFTCCGLCEKLVIWICADHHLREQQPMEFEWILFQLTLQKIDWLVFQLVSRFPYLLAQRRLSWSFLAWRLGGILRFWRKLELRPTSNASQRNSFRYFFRKKTKFFCFYFLCFWKNLCF